MRLIIDIQDGISPHVALQCVERVINGGRISGNGKSYCYASSFITSEGDVWVYCHDNKKSDKFFVEKKWMKSSDKEIYELCDESK